MLLITGANGRPGSAVVREFARRGEPVRALVRSAEKASAIAAPGVETVVGDMLEPDTLGPALTGVDRVLMISGAGPLLLETQCTFIDAARAAGVRHVVKFSGQDSVDGFDPERFRSTRSHEQVQRYLSASGLAWTMLRPSQFMQVYLEEAADIARVGELRLPLGATTLAPVDIADIAAVAYRILTTPGHEGRTYRMTGPEALDMDEVAGRIAAATGRPVRYVDVPPEERHRQWLAAGHPPPRAAAFAQLFAERRRLGRSSVHLDTHRAFGVRPTEFADFAARHAAVFRGAAAVAGPPA
ncbi:SDR family oxidoreductase [Dactylosporangium vinaceum]|uniref:SDR family oxidoreductase n=1 Tax=Dactylosporangium vinaceum TaxID=53362 RepID=A0ABV5MAJ0_9ACTN|nr:SDR family oxidoreductase [Dactylosporangium vinaceum]UAB92998.1 SDR family oxidoreductase [Dactylosporangium vinaceum]